MSSGILLSLVGLAIFVTAVFYVYRRVMRNLAPDDSVRQVSGARLTSERLQALPMPPWRVVVEIADDKLGGVDHVAIGPPGVIAMSTVMTDRPGHTDTPDPQLVAAAAMMRGPVDELAQRAGLRCDLLAKVFWGTPQPERPAAFESVHATMAVEGQRLGEWLAAMPGASLTQAQIDLAWQVIVTGIGRPDPLA